MKKELKRIYRRMMRQIARFILGFENCPRDCKRDFIGQMYDVLICVCGGIGVVMVFFIFFLACC